MSTSLRKPPRVQNLIIQGLVLAAVLALIALVGYNYIQNISRRNIGIGFGFLGQTAGFSITQTLIPYQETDTFGRTFVVGLLNTLLASGVSIILASLLGFAVGLMLLSRNPVVIRISRAYLELLRNVPPLLHVLFWYQVVFLHLLPDLRASWVFQDLVYINVRGITLPEFHPSRGYGLTMGLLVLGMSLLILLQWHRRNLRRQGFDRQVWPFQVLILGGLVLSFLFLEPFRVVAPELGKFNFVKGFTIRPEFFSLVIALSTYTSTYLADIVRSSIQQVPKGQVEAAMSLGFGPALRMRLVIIPQAVRTMIPPATNQFLNLMKNTSLGIAIAYPDLTAVFAGTTLNQTGRALEVMAMVMVTYLGVSLVTSVLMNRYNRRILDPKGIMKDTTRSLSTGKEPTSEN